jgi:two-component system chemotaxis response regulator CheY
MEMEKPLSALVVDDSGIMRKLVMRALTESRLARFAFIEATDGADAFAKFQAQPVDIIFVDWNMPNMNGIDFVRKVRETQKQHVPVIMITTERTMGKVEEAMTNAGVDAYVCKPFTTAVLTQKLQPVLAKCAAPVETGFFSKLVGKLS